MHDGIILININNLNNDIKLISEHSDLFTGKRQWGPYTSDKLYTPEEAAEIIQRAQERDPDMWVIEIEDRNMVNPFEVA